MITGYRVYKTWCPKAKISDTGQLSIPFVPATVKVVEAVDRIIYRMMKS